MDSPHFYMFVENKSRINQKDKIRNTKINKSQLTLDKAQGFYMSMGMPER